METHKPAPEASCPVDKALNTVREARVEIDAAFARIKALTAVNRGQAAAMIKTK